MKPQVKGGTMVAMCDERAPATGCRCTRPRGHLGDHVSAVSGVGQLPALRADRFLAQLPDGSEMPLLWARWGPWGEWADDDEMEA